MTSIITDNMKRNWSFIEGSLRTEREGSGNSLWYGYGILRTSQGMS